MHELAAVTVSAHHVLSLTLCLTVFGAPLEARLMLIMQDNFEILFSFQLSTFHTLNQMEEKNVFNTSCIRFSCVQVEEMWIFCCRILCVGVCIWKNCGYFDMVWVYRWKMHDCCDIVCACMCVQVERRYMDL